jgi:hypothetical protein
MRLMLVLSTVAMLLTSYGCSCVPTVERANLTSAASREEFTKTHPDCAHNDCIKNGEIVRGMSAHEVMASWGLPNVYIVTRTSPSEQWIYYVRDRDSLSMLIYTLGFADDTLRVWDVDQKRPVGLGIATANENPRNVRVPTPGDPRKR